MTTNEIQMANPKYPKHLLHTFAFDDVLAGNITSLDELVTKYGVAETTIRHWQSRWFRTCLYGDIIDDLIERSTSIQTREDVRAWGALADSGKRSNYEKAFQILLEHREIIFASRIKYARTKSNITHVTPGGGNIFSDLGFEPVEAERLLAESDAVISNKLAIRISMMKELADWIDSQNLTPTEAAEHLGVPRSRVTDLHNKNASKFTIDTLVDLLVRTGKHIHLTVH